MADKKRAIDDATKVLIYEVIPTAVKWLLDNIPKGQYEKIFQEKEKHWNMVLPFFSFAILRVTNASEVIDDITTNFFAELKREINRRMGDIQTAKIPNRVDAIAEMAKYPSLLKKFSNLDDRERKAMLFHFVKLPPNYFQIISEMDSPDFQLYVEIVLMKAEEQLGAKAKKIGEDILGALKEWREEDKKKPSIADAFRAGLSSRKTELMQKANRKPKNWFVRHRYLTLLATTVLAIVAMVLIRIAIK